MESFDIDHLNEFASYIEGWLGQRLRKGIVSAAVKYVSHIKEVISDSDPKPVDMGLYRAGWQFEKRDYGADVYNSVPYASIIEFGARSQNIKIGRKMIDALASWVMRKGLVGKFAKTASGKRVRKTVSERAQESRQIAWAIAKAMQQRGIFAGGKGLRVEERARAKLEAILQEEVTRELGK